MNKFTSAVKAFIADENGITAIEYALMAALIGGALIGVTKAFGVSMTDAFTTLGTSVTTHATF